jgi:hypothetical protein
MAPHVGALCVISLFVGVFAAAGWEMEMVGRWTRMSLDANERVRLEKVDRGKKLGSEKKQNTNPRLNPDVAAFATKTKTVQMQHGMT